jgi:hypothetical protein
MAPLSEEAASSKPSSGITWAPRHEPGKPPIVTSRVREGPVLNGPLSGSAMRIDGDSPDRAFTLHLRLAPCPDKPGGRVWVPVMEGAPADQFLPRSPFLPPTRWVEYGWHPFWKGFLFSRTGRLKRGNTTSVG